MYAAWPSGPAGSGNPVLGGQLLHEGIVLGDLVESGQVGVDRDKTRIVALHLLHRVTPVLGELAQEFLANAGLQRITHLPSMPPRS